MELAPEGGKTKAGVPRSEPSLVSVWIKSRNQVCAGLPASWETQVSAPSTMSDLNTEIFTGVITFDLWVSDLFSGPPREAEGPHPLWEDGAESKNNSLASSCLKYQCIV